MSQQPNTQFEGLSIGILFRRCIYYQMLSLTNNGVEKVDANLIWSIQLQIVRPYSSPVTNLSNDLNIKPLS